MPVSAVSFGEWLNDLPAPPRGPGSQSEAMDIARTRPDPVTLERDWCLWFGSHALHRPPGHCWSLPVCPPHPVTSPLCLVPSLGSSRPAWSPGHRGGLGDAGPAVDARPRLWLGPLGFVPVPGAGPEPRGLSAHAGLVLRSAGGLCPHEGNTNTVCSQVTGGPRPENAWETVTDLQPTW